MWRARQEALRRDALKQTVVIDGVQPRKKLRLKELYESIPLPILILLVAYGPMALLIIITVVTYTYFIIHDAIWPLTQEQILDATARQLGGTLEQFRREQDSHVL